MIEETAARLYLTREDGGWTGVRKGRREEARQGEGSEAGNERGREGRWKRGSAEEGREVRPLVTLLIEEHR